ncbi:hypothetical protein BKA64DRAFT_688810 [Cadophora sp. MPI-SDFR-AT-0126]|nr:hypothetical protein BKA64DRAFT_688810 [Leotiomycetes sp. MPI-SDFR-AT-0126]
MVNIKVSQTGLINPPGVTPVLTLDQMWRGLVYKSREPQKFVAAVEHRDIVSEHDNGLTRIEYFKPGLGPPAGKVTGDCEYWAPHRTTFSVRGSGEVVINIISTDLDDPSILYLTFCIDWPHPAIQAGSSEETEMFAKRQGMIKQIVRQTIDVIREMVKSGEL